MRTSAREAFQPIAVRPPNDAPIRFALRCIVDLQLLTIYRFLRSHASTLHGRLLDVGAGESPWRHLSSGVDYVGIDVEAADQFGMRRNPSIVYYDGHRIPFPDASFDHVLCVEVLEHVGDPRPFVREMARVLRPGGSLMLTVPWSARLHHLPHDYHRFSRQALQSLFSSEGFEAVRVEDRGDDIAVIANKLLIMTIRLWRPRQGLQLAWRWPLAVLLTPLVGLFIAAAQLSVRYGAGQVDDPLGYGLVAKRR